jgi:hypothetical protein
MENEEGSNFLQRVITGDESWICEYDLETKRQSEDWSVVVRIAAKKCPRVVQQSRSCSLLFLIFEEWSIMNLFHRGKQLMLHFTWKF